jgi:Concanavalin A-like lectin/glucanases superfamily
VPVGSLPAIIPRDVSSRARVGVVFATAVVGAAALVGLLVRDRNDSGECPPPEQSYAALVRSDGAIGYWRLDEATGNIAENSATSGPDGKYVRPNAGRQVLDNVGVFANDAAIDLYGGGAYVSIPPFARYQRLPNWSVEAWVRPTEATWKRGDVALLSHAWDRSSLPFVLGFGSYNGRYRDGRHAWTGFYDQVKRRWSRVADTAALTRGTWTHLVGTYDGKSIRLYRNGLLVNSKAASGAPLAGKVPLYIGTRWWLASSQFFFGLVDEVALYPTALGPTQIERHYAGAQLRRRALAGC